MKRGTSDIGLIASSVLELPILLHYCRSIVTSIILSESEFGDHIGVRANRGDLKAKPSKGVKEGRNGEADCVDLCASLFCVCG